MVLRVVLRKVMGRRLTQLTVILLGFGTIMIAPWLRLLQMRELESGDDDWLLNEGFDKHWETILQYFSWIMIYAWCAIVIQRLQCFCNFVLINRSGHAVFSERDVAEMGLIKLGCMKIINDLYIFPGVSNDTLVLDTYKKRMNNADRVCSVSRRTIWYICSVYLYFSRPIICWVKRNLPASLHFYRMVRNKACPRDR